MFYYYLILKKKYFEKENVSCEFVGHPLIENNQDFWEN